MKILHIIPSVAACRGGTSQSVLEMVNALLSIGLDVDLVTTNDNGNSLLDVPLNCQVDYRGTPVRFFQRFSPNIVPIREYAFSLTLTKWLIDNISNYDLVHIHALFSYPATLGMTIARIKNIPYITTPHGLLCEWSLQQKSQKKQLYLNVIERRNINSSNALYLTTFQEQDEVSQLNLTPPCFVIPLGLDISPDITDASQQLRAWLKIPLDTPVILFMSRIHQKKGLDYLIPALAQHKDRDFTFVIAGTGTLEYEIEIDRLIAEYGIEHLTKRVGFVSGETKQLLLQGADLFALTSQSENFGISVLEALAAGLPVLLTPGVALARMVVEKNLGYVVPLCIEDISSALLSFFESPELAEQIGCNAKEYVKYEYSWHRIVSQLKDTYISVIKESKSIS